MENSLLAILDEISCALMQRVWPDVLVTLKFYGNLIGISSN